MTRDQNGEIERVEGLFCSVSVDVEEFVVALVG